MRGYLLFFAKVKAGRTDFKEKVLERAKNRKGGDFGAGKVGRNQDESSFFSHIFMV